MKIALFLDIIGRGETFSEHGCRVSGVSKEKNKLGQDQKNTNWDLTLLATEI